MSKRTLLGWSSGKDSAWALHVLRQRNDIEVVGLFTTVSEAYQRVVMHAVRLELLKLQADAVNLPLHIINIPIPCSNKQYKSVMSRFIEEVKSQGIEYMAFGDIYLLDVRKYREVHLKDTGITPIFPLWQQPTGRISKDMLLAGLKAFITCVNPKYMPSSFAGRQFDQQLLDDLPATVDPLGENGEFHTFAVDGPMFVEPIAIRVGEIIEREGFVFAELFHRSSTLGTKDGKWN